MSFFCRECGNESRKWQGRCPACGAWDTLEESTKVTGKKPPRGNTSFSVAEDDGPPRPMTEDVNAPERLAFGLGELDNVLGGGLTQAMTVLVGGEPGIGKSTLMLQASRLLAQKGNKVLYVSGEESRSQIVMRAKRIGVTEENLLLYCSTDLETVLTQLEHLQPALAIIDSIQSIGAEADNYQYGGAARLRNAAAAFVRLAKSRGIAMFLIGHVTKDGFLAGPRIIEHMVDTVLYFEGERQNRYKMLRAVKNRFGSTNEIGLFEMGETGLTEVLNPSLAFIPDAALRPGTAVGTVVEGSRAFLVEVQTLVNPGGYGPPQRVAVGLEQKRLAVILAVCEKYLGLGSGQADVFLALAGGIKAFDPSLDLAAAAAVFSSRRDLPLPAKTLFAGEIGLAGGVRPLPQADLRLKEAARLGFTNAIIGDKTQVNTKGMKIRHIAHLAQLAEVLNI